MSSPRPVDAALATLRQRWGMAAPRAGREAFGEVIGALATVPLPVEPELEPELEPGSGWPVAPRPQHAPEPGTPTEPAGHPVTRPDRGALAPVIPTGFAELDAILGPGGVPRTAGLALSGDLSSGRTTLALRLIAEAQATGSIVAYLDIDRAFDPVEAVARGVRLEWLVVVVPASVEEGLAMAGAVLQGRAVDLLIVDLPPRLRGSARLADALARLAALARRAGALLVVLEPPGRTSGDAWLGSAVGLRLELRRRGWIRLGRDVVGQRTEAEVARSRFGPPGRRAELRILYADGGPRDGCLRRSPLLDEGPPGRVDRPAPPSSRQSSPQGTVIERSDATPPPLLAAPPPPARPRALVADPGGPTRLRVVPARPRGARGAAMDRRDRPGRGRRGPRAGSQARDAARSGAPAGA